MRVFINGVPQPKRFGQVRLQESRSRLGGSLRRSRCESEGDGASYGFSNWDVFKGSIHSLVFSGDDMKSILTAMTEPLNIPNDLVSSVKLSVGQNKKGGETWSFQFTPDIRMSFLIDEGGKINSGSWYEDGVRLRPVPNMWVLADNGTLHTSLFYWLESQIAPLLRSYYSYESRRFLRR